MKSTFYISKKLFNVYLIGTICTAELKAIEGLLICVGCYQKYI